MPKVIIYASPLTVTIEGPAGSGKSRLANKFVEVLIAQGFASLTVDHEGKENLSLETH